MKTVTIPITEKGNYTAIAVSPSEDTAQGNTVAIYDVNIPKTIEQLSQIYFGENGVFYWIDTYGDQYVKAIINPLLPDIDFEYSFNHSQHKALSRLIYGIIGRNRMKNKYIGYPLSSEDWKTIVNVINHRFGGENGKWNKLFVTISAQYDATKPYNMDFTESRSGESKNESTGSSNSDDTETRDLDQNRSTYKRGFNNTGTQVSENVETVDTGTVKNESQNSATQSDNQNFTQERTYNQSGNIGNKSPMELLDEERRFAAWQLLDVIMDDVDSVIAAYYYI